MKKLLITAFEPFGGETKNSSLLAVSALPDVIGEYELVKLTVPCVFGLAGETVIAKAREIKPDAILSVGQNETSNEVTPEYVGINLRNARIPDNAGNQPLREPIDPDGPAAYFAALPVFEMDEAIKAAGIPSSVSYSAGTFVCNDLLYSILHEFNGTGVRAGFIHLPLSEEQLRDGLPFMETSDAAKALIKAIEVL
ncbi:MAG: pyroglutamyl-peptidase I [Firmicutes bacterium]|nr:pyroglutamyl-peptidase I [Bacillota bacterium]